MSSKLFGKRVKVKNGDNVYRFVEFIPGNVEQGSECYALIMSTGGRIEIRSADMLIFDTNQPLFDEEI